MLGKARADPADPRRSGRAGGDDFPVAEKERAGHLQAVAGEVAEAAALEDRDRAAPPDVRAEEFEEPALAESERPIELAARIGDAGDAAALAEILDFLAALQHVDEHQLRTVGVGLLLDPLQPAQDLAGERAAEVAEENQHEQPGLRGFCQSHAVGERVGFRRLRDAERLGARRRHPGVGAQAGPQDHRERSDHTRSSNSRIHKLAPGACR